jgi:hypothetical protein
MTTRAATSPADTQRPTQTDIAGRWAMFRLAVSALLCVVALGMLVYKLPVYPQIGSDEWWILGRTHLILREFTFEDRVSSDTDLRGVSRSPYPPMNIPLRYAIHKVLNADVEIDRAISAVQFVVVGTLFVAVAWRLGAGLDIALLGLPMFLLTPAVFYVARTVRYEQDVFFLGAVAVILSFVVSRPSRWWLPLSIASGMAAGMASVMHLFGIAFGASIGLAHALLWLLGDRRRLRWRVVVAWVAAFAVPVVFTAGYYLSEPSLNHGADVFLRPREAEQLAHRMAFLRSLFPPPLPGLPNRVVETMNALRWGLMPHIPELVPRATAVVLTGLGVVAVFTVCGGLTAETVRRLRRGRLGRQFDISTLILLTLWLLSPLLVALTGLRPHTDYVVYVHGAMVLSSFMLVALGTTLGHRAWARSGPRWLALAAVVAVELGYLGPVLAARAEPPGVAIGVQMQAMDRISTALGLEPAREDGPPVYADLTAWAASGARHAPLFDYMILERVTRRPEVGAIVFDADWYDGMVADIAPATGAALDPDRRRARMAALMDGLELGAVLRIDPGFARPPDTRFWYVRQAPPEPLFGIVAVDGSMSMRPGQPIADRADAVQAGPVRTVHRVRLDAGDYFAQVSGTSLTTSRIDANIGRREFNGRPIRNFPQEYGGGRVWVTLQRPAEVRFVLETDSPAASDVRLRIWRIGDAPADN